MIDQQAVLQIQRPDGITLARGSDGRLVVEVYTVGDAGGAREWLSLGMPRPDRTAENALGLDLHPLAKACLDDFVRRLQPGHRRPR